MNIHRISWHEITHDAIHYFTHADKGVFYLLRKLATGPGVVAREYLAGKRTRYFKPLNFFLLVVAIVVFMTSLLNSESKPNIRRGSAQTNSGQLSEANKQKYRMMTARYQKVNKFTSRYSNVISMLATPLFAFFLLLFYLKRPYNYTEHLVSNLYFVGFIMLFYGLVFVPLMHFTKGMNTLYYSMLGLFFVFESIYRGVAYYQLMNQKGKRYLFKAIGISVLLSILWASGTAFLIRQYIISGFEGLLP